MRCESPSVRKSRSTAPPATRRLSPSSTPESSSPSPPGIRRRIVSPTRCRQRYAGPLQPPAHPSTLARQARPPAASPRRDDRLAQSSSGSGGSRIAPNATRCPISGGRSSGQLTETRRPRKPASCSKTVTVDPNSPSRGSPTTTPVHSRALASRHRRTSARQPAPAMTAIAMPTARPPSMRHGHIPRPLRPQAKEATAASTQAATARSAAEAEDRSPTHTDHESPSPITHPTHTARASQATAGIDGRVSA